jgi:hypothetical protein
MPDYWALHTLSICSYIVMTYYYLKAAFGDPGYVRKLHSDESEKKVRAMNGTMTLLSRSS